MGVDESSLRLKNKNYGTKISDDVIVRQFQEQINNRIKKLCSNYSSLIYRM